MHQHRDMQAATAGTARALQQSILLGSLAFGILSFLLPVYGKQLGASALEISGLFSAFALTSLLARPCIGWALDRFGRKRFFVGALICYAGAMGLFSLASNLPTLYLARIVQGVGSSLLWLSAYTIATDGAKPGERGYSIGRVDEAAARGALYGALAGFTLLSALQLRAGWSALFAGYAVLAVAGAWLAWRRVPETQPQFAARSPETRLLGSPLLKLLVIVFITSGSTAMIGPLLLVFAQDKFGADIGTLALAYIPAALVASYLPSRMGRLSDRFGRAPLVAIGLAGSGLVSLLLPELPGMSFLIVLWVLESLGWAIAGPAEGALVADLTEGEVRGTGYGLYTFATGLGATGGPLLGGWLYDTVGRAAPFYLNGCLLLSGAILVVLLLGGWDRLPEKKGV